MPFRRQNFQCRKSGASAFVPKRRCGSILPQARRILLDACESCTAPNIMPSIGKVSSGSIPVQACRKRSLLKNDQTGLDTGLVGSDVSHHTKTLRHDVSRCLEAQRRQGRVLAVSSFLTFRSERKLRHATLALRIISYPAQEWHSHQQRAGVSERSNFFH